MFKFFCLVLFIASALATQSDGDSIAGKSSVINERFIGGDDASKGVFPHQVSLRDNGGTHHFCGGSIIGSRFILTAAQCTQGQNSQPNNFHAVVGALRISSGGTHYTIEQIVNHPNYDQETMANDISVLRTETNMVFSWLVRASVLPTKDTPAKGNVPVIVSGWGQYREVIEFLTFDRFTFTFLGILCKISIEKIQPDSDGKPENHPDILQSKQMVTLNLPDCILRLGSNGEKVHANTLCTNNLSGEGICNGDTGGPLINLQWPRVVIGIASWTSRPCAQGFPDVYARVFPHLSFIRDAMQVWIDSVWILVWMVIR